MLTGKLQGKKYNGKPSVHHFTGQIVGELNGTTGSGTLSADARTVICPTCTNPEDRELVQKNFLVANWRVAKPGNP